MYTSLDTDADEAADNPGPRPRVLVVDDAPPNVAILRQLLSREGCEVLTAANGVEALEIVRKQPLDLVLTDIVMPGGDGLTLCRAIKTDPSTRLIPVVLVTSLHGREQRISGSDAGADDFVVKPFDAFELRARVKSLLRLKRYTDELDSAEAVILSLAMTVEARDAYTEGHCQRLAKFAVSLASRVGLPAADIEALQRGAILHDVGKIGIPDAVLLKPGRLTAEECALMQQHTVIGDRLCSELRLLQRVRPIVRHHHERLDGSGYPDGLRGSAVPLLAQIVGLVDVYDAVTTVRPYKLAMSQARALQELTDEARKGWRDRTLVTEFIACCGDGAIVGV